uniref:Polyprotein protein n=1 Tax=Solanum tuberosum TaxID=4113 RepID=M1DAH7_SOLTU
MDILTLWGDVPLSDVTTLKMPSVAPSSYVLEVAIDGNADDEKLDEETDEEGLGEDEHGIAETLTELHETEEVIVQATLERFLRETSVVGSSGVTPDSPTLPTVEPGTDAHIDPSLSPPMILLPRIDVPLEVSPPETPE